MVEDREKLLLLSAAEAGYVRFAISRIARAAECSEASVRMVLSGALARGPAAERVYGVLGVDEDGKPPSEARV